MYSSLKNWLLRLIHPRPSEGFILLGIDYPSHALASAMQQRGLRVIAFIDEEPWNHRTQMLGATVHYPIELAALAQRHAVSKVIRFSNSSIEIPSEVLVQLRNLDVEVVAIDTQNLALEAQMSRALGA